ncbi:RidA family protein [Salmonella enterica subsp. enterica]|nr:RidA family protein [Salmonella enterica subsp. enterica]
MLVTMSDKELRRINVIQSVVEKRMRRRDAVQQVGSHTDGTPEPDFQKQVRLAFENLKATLTAAGCTFDDIVDVTTFHTDPEQQLNDVMAVKQEIFAHPPYPNWTAVGVTWLAGFDFEIKVIARIP